MLNGEKLWISNAPEADIYAVFARTADSGEARGARGLTAFAVPGDSPGLSGEPRELLAPHPIGSLRFDGVPVGADQVLGGIRGRLPGRDAHARPVSAERRRVRRSVWPRPHCRWPRPTRWSGGHSASRCVTTRRSPTVSLTCGLAPRPRGCSCTRRPALTIGASRTRVSPRWPSCCATEVAQEAVDAAIQFHGAVALEHGHPLEHLYREVRAPRIYEGASEIQREIIARAMFRAAEPRIGGKAVVSRTVVVTGGARGIGLATVTRFSAAGDTVIALGRDPAALAKLSVSTHVCDVTDGDAVAAVFAEIGAVDVLVNNAGIGESAPLHRTTLADWTRHLEVNATGPFLCLQAVLPGMRERGSGVIVNVASTAGRIGVPYTAAYTASKHALVGLTRAAAAELAGTGVRVNAVCPTFVRTEMTVSVDRHHRGRHRPAASRTPRRRLPPPLPSVGCSSPRRSPTRSPSSRRRVRRRSPARRS